MSKCDWPGKWYMSRNGKTSKTIIEDKKNTRTKPFVQRHTTANQMTGRPHRCLLHHVLAMNAQKLICVTI